MYISLYACVFSVQPYLHALICTSVSIFVDYWLFIRWLFNEPLHHISEIVIDRLCSYFFFSVNICGFLSL